MHPEEGLNFPDKYHGQDIDKVGNIDLTNPENWRKAHPMGFTAKPEIVNPRTHSDFLDKEDKFLLNAFSDGGEVRIINDKVVYRGADNKTTTIGTIRVVDGDKRIYKSPFAKAFIKEDTDELVENWAKENGYSVWKEDFGSSYEGGGYIVQDSWKESGIGNLSIQQTKKVAEKYAKALSIADNEVYSVNPSVEENSFDLDVEGDEYGGGSYLIYGDGSVVNVAITPNARYGSISSSVDEIISKVLNIEMQRENAEYKDRIRWDGSVSGKEIVSEIKYEGGGSPENEVYIEFLNKEKNFTKDRKSFKTYEDAVKWARENFDKFNPDMIHYYSGGGGIKQSMVYDIDGTEYLVHEPIQDIKGNYSGWTCYKAVFETKNGERHLNYERTKTIGNRKWFSNEHILKGKIVEDYYSGGGEVVYDNGIWKVKTTDEDYNRSGRRYWQTMTERNEYIDKTFKSKEDAEKWIEDYFSKGGGVIKIPIAIKRRIDEINELLPKVQESGDIAGGYFGGTHYTYLELLKPIEIKNQYVYITGNNSGYYYQFEKRYNVNLKDNDIYGLPALKYDLSNILKSFKKVLQNNYSGGGSTVKPLPADIIKHKDLMNRSDYTAYVKINDYPYTATVRKLNSFKEHLNRKDEKFTPNVFGEITYISDNASDEWVYQLQKLIDEKKKELQTYYNGGMTRNEHILESFLTSNKNANVNNLSTHYAENENQILLRNYGTLIALRRGNDVKITSKKYSKTTSTIQNALERMAKNMGMNVSRVDEFDAGGQLSEISDMLPHSEPMGVIQPMNIMETVQPMYAGGGEIRIYNDFGDNLLRNFKSKKDAIQYINTFKGGSKGRLDVEIGNDIIYFWGKESDDEVKELINSVDTYAKGGSAKAFWDKTKSFGKKASSKAKEYGKKGVEATKKAIHDAKKKNAMNVLDETLNNRNLNKEDKYSVVEALQIVDDVYAGGGGLENKRGYSKMDSFINEDGEEISLYWHSAYDEMVISKNGDIWKRYLLPEDESKAINFFIQWKNHSFKVIENKKSEEKRKEMLKSIFNALEEQIKYQDKTPAISIEQSIMLRDIMRNSYGFAGGGSVEKKLRNNRQLVPSREILDKEEYNDFIKYVHRWSADKTRSQVKEAINRYIIALDNQNFSSWGGGDTIDRERAMVFLENPKLKTLPNLAEGGGVEEKKQMSRTVLNDAVKKLIKNNGTDINKYSEYDLNTLKSFVSPRDLTEEMCQKIWGLAIENGFEGYQSKVIVFNSGTGKLLNYVDNEFARVDAINPDKDENVVATLLNNKDVINVHTDSLKTLNRYNLAIINNKQKSELTDLKLVTNKLNSNNLLIFVSPMNCLNNETIKSFINDNYDLLDAYCVEEGYYHNGAVIEGSIISVLKKL